ncbi:MAG: glycosyltransferase family 39 protein [Methanoregula sp.]|jgi:4-amino-4-deoxy-L-arabinose transferase-like glycosyltransferase|nr:glycosyltransferase family 39 protein [Methanoregula sp.]
MNEESLLRKYRMEFLLAGILLLSGFLNIWNIWIQGYSNSYYAAAVVSMLKNPGVLFFNSFDAGGFITVDKPPLGLWVQVASAALLGFSGWSVVLPQALAGVGSVALIYFIVSRPFGKPAGLVAAFALAVTPIFVAVSRNGTMDGILIFVLLLSIWAALKAAQENSLPLLLLAVIMIGLGFNIKMIQAFIAVPAVILVYLLGAGGVPVKKRLLHIGFAIAVLMAVSLSWAVAVDMIPADQRPYIGGSGDNTVMGLIVNYNGIHRLESDGQSAGGNRGSVLGGSSGTQEGPGDIQPVMTFSRTQTSDRMIPDAGSPPQGGMASGTSTNTIQGSAPPQGTMRAQSTSGGRTGGGMMDETGSPGVLRLFGSGLAGQISWLLPFALIGLLAFPKRPESISMKGLEDAGYFSERALTLLALCLWLFAGLTYFSFTTGFWHTYYLATIAPPLAGIAGIGAMGLYREYFMEGIRGWLLVAAVLVTGFAETIILLYNAEFSGVLVLVLAIGTFCLTIILAFLAIRMMTNTGMFPQIVVAVAIGLLFIAPFVWACTPLAYGAGNSLPVAGPQLAKNGGGSPGGNTGSGMTGSNLGLSSYLISHHAGEQWIVAVSSSREAANIILNTGEPVMALGGFSGSDQVLTTESLKNLINEGRIRYFYTSASSEDRAGTSGNGAISSWVSSNCAVVASSEYGAGDTQNRIAGETWQDTRTTNSSLMTPTGMSRNAMTAFRQAGGNALYDCQGAPGSTTNGTGS